MLPLAAVRPVAEPAAVAVLRTEDASEADLPAAVAALRVRLSPLALRRATAVALLLLEDAVAALLEPAALLDATALPDAAEAILVPPLRYGSLVEVAVWLNAWFLRT